MEGSRSKLTRRFKHLNLDFRLQEANHKLKVDTWFDTRRTMAAICMAISHVQNIITGVTKGYCYKMCFVYTQFGQIQAQRGPQIPFHPGKENKPQPPT